MSPVAAGGVVAWLVTDTETGMTRVNEYKTIEGAAWMKQEALVRQSELDELIADVAEYQANLTAECNARIAAEDALTAARSEADRLRVDAERWRFIMDRYQGAAFVEGNKNWELRFAWEFNVPMNRGYGALNEAVDAAKTEQERGE